MTMTPELRHALTTDECDYVAPDPSGPPSTGDDEYDAVLAKAADEYAVLSISDEKLLSWYIETMSDWRTEADLAEAEYKVLTQRLAELQEQRRRRMNEACVRQMALEHHFGGRVRPLVDAALAEKNTKADGTPRAKQVKMVNLAAGKAGYRKKPISLDIVDETLAVQWASRNLVNAVKQTVSKSALREYVKGTGGKVEIPGTVMKGGQDEFFPVAPPLKHKSTPFERHHEVLSLADGTKVDTETGEEVARKR